MQRKNIKFKYDRDRQQPLQFAAAVVYLIIVFGYNKNKYKFADIEKAVGLDALSMVQWKISYLDE